MKPALIVAACLATLVAYTTAQIAPLAGVAAPVIPPIMPPMFAGMPFPFFGPFGPLGMLGLGGFGFGLGGLGLGLGLGGIGGIGRFGLGGLGGLGGIGGIGGIRRFGKRDVDSFKTIKCTIGAKCFDCTFGFGQRMACNVEPRLGGIEDSLKLRLVGLGVSGKSSEGVKFVELISKKDSSYTFVNPSTDKPVSLAIFWGDLDKTGFQVKDKTCWETLLKTVADDGREVKVNLIL